MERAFRLLPLILLAACAAKEPLPITPPAEIKDSPIVRRPLDNVAPPGVAAPSQPSTPSASALPAPIVVPPNTLYVCVTDNHGEPRQTAIEFGPKVGALCKRHPEMGPCQYERDMCRRSGGRVYAANGVEITQQTEDEYDRKVLRVRFRAN